MAPVQLYVYDLSNGLARSLSFQLTGKQIDGVWHTSVVVFGKEIYYGPYNAGPGIQVTAPGRSHHGRPLKIENMGETDIDEETFWEYINEVKEQYTGDKYHLLDFNCNSFTNDCVGFLTGGTIPSWIKDLPADFLSTPFGQSMRPTIDNTFRRPLPPAAAPVPATAASLPPAASTANAATLTSPVHIASNPASFKSTIVSNRIVIAFFTSDTCPPCKVIEPIFRDMAYSKNREGVAFVEVNLSTGSGQTVAREWNISATPTFLFFLDGKQSADLKGANAPELKTQVDLLFFEAFPPHPHTKLNLPTIRATSLAPILYSQPPSYDALYAKFTTFIDSSPLSDKAAAKTVLSGIVLPFLKDRFPPKADVGKRPVPTLPPQFLPAFTQTSRILLKTLPPSEIFPVVDLWRVAILDEKVASWLALSATRADGKDTDIISIILQHVHDLFDGAPRNLLLTTLRLASNCFASRDLTRHILTPASTSSSSTPPRSLLTSILVPALLHDDATIRTAAASLAFNIAAYVQTPLIEAARAGNTNLEASGGGDWEVEIVSALVEGLGRESISEEVVHRLAAALAFMIHLSPHYVESVQPLLEVLQAKEVLETKVALGGCVVKEDVKKLVREVILLCGSA